MKKYLADTILQQHTEFSSRISLETAFKPSCFQKVPSFVRREFLTKTPKVEDFTQERLKPVRPRFPSPPLQFEFLLSLHAILLFYFEAK